MNSSKIEALKSNFGKELGNCDEEKLKTILDEFYTVERESFSLLKNNLGSDIAMLVKAMGFLDEVIQHRNSKKILISLLLSVIMTKEKVDENSARARLLELVLNEVGAIQLDKREEFNPIYR